MSRFSRWLRIVGASALVAAPLWITQSVSVIAQEKSPGKATSSTLPSAETVLDGYVDAIGGKEALAKIKSRRSEGTFEMKEAGLKADLIMLQAAPNSMLVTIDIEGIGKIENGTDGEVAWEVNPLTGNRKIDGEQRSELIRRALFQQEANWRDIYESAKVTGEEKVGDRSVWVVQLKPKGSENMQTNFYDKETKLILKSKTTVATPQGAIPMEIAIGDYREVDGVKISHSATQSVMGQTQIFAMTKIEHNQEIDPKVFNIPWK